MGRTFFFRGQGKAETKSSEKEFEGVISCIQGSERRMGLMYRLRSWTLEIDNGKANRMIL